MPSPADRPTGRSGRQAGVRVPVSLRRRVVAAFTERLRLKASAVAIAVLIWFIITSRESAMEVRAVRFQPEMDSALVLRGPLPPIDVRLVGQSSELQKLGAAPLVMRRQIAATEADTVVIDLRGEDLELPSGVLVSVRDFRPPRLTLRFEPPWTRRVPVQSAVRIVLADGATPVIAAIDPESVEVTGPRAAVMRVPFVRTDTTLLTAHDSIPVLVALDTAGLGVRVRPTQVKVRIIPATPPPVRIDTAPPPDTTRSR